MELHARALPVHAFLIDGPGPGRLQRQPRSKGCRYAGSGSASAQEGVGAIDDGTSDDRGRSRARTNRFARDHGWGRLRRAPGLRHRLLVAGRFGPSDDDPSCDRRSGARVGRRHRPINPAPKGVGMGGWSGGRPDPSIRRYVTAGSAGPKDGQGRHVRLVRSERGANFGLSATSGGDTGRTRSPHREIIRRL